jgi:hypothetical protein
MHSCITANILSGLFNHHPKHFIMPYSIKQREKKKKRKKNKQLVNPRMKQGQEPRIEHTHHWAVPRTHLLDGDQSGTFCRIPGWSKPTPMACTRTRGEKGSSAT